MAGLEMSRQAGVDLGLGMYKGKPVDLGSDGAESDQWLNGI